jgi:hypothetical protein
MKNVLLTSLLVLSTASISKAQENWSVVSSEQRERDQIMLQIAYLSEEFTALTNASLSSPCLTSAIEQLLKRIGTPVSYKIYQEMKASGQL